MLAGAAPLLSLRLGTLRALVVSAYAAAKECFMAHDAALASLILAIISTKDLIYSRNTVPFLSVGICH